MPLPSASSGLILSCRSLQERGRELQADAIAKLLKVHYQVLKVLDFCLQLHSFPAFSGKQHNQFLFSASHSRLLSNALSIKLLPGVEELKGNALSIKLLPGLLSNALSKPLQHNQIG
ncbi:hypothetical protein L2E82_05156 [Cichorium intybus]|uniref:Uncharacterized protein n=1 Tax=Cichorium intybus TaxID=13427 RepID=A0ACB9H7T7_CICIN|nr:hypothetical protein L2E82_05156 [Cichorium intybus]